MRLRKFSFILCVIYILMLWGCTGNPQNDLPSTTLDGIEENQSTPTRNNGVFSMCDFASIIPGQSTIYDTEQIYGDYGTSYFDWVKYIQRLQGEGDGNISIVSALPERVVYQIGWGLGRPLKSFTDLNIVIDPLPSISAFLSIIPGKTNYKEIAEICNQDLGEFPRDEALYVHIPIQNDCYVSVTIDTNGVVLDFNYGCELESIQPAHTFKFYDFYQNTPGQSTFAQIDALALEKGFLLGRGDIQPPDDKMWLVLPAEKRSRITIIGTWSDDKIQSIELYNVTKYSGESEEIAVEMSSDIVVSLMTNITPPHDTYKKIEEICGHDFGSFPREKGLVIRIPMENACEFIVRIHRDGSVVSLQWKSIDWESEGD